MEKAACGNKDAARGKRQAAKGRNAGVSRTAGFAGGRSKSSQESSSRTAGAAACDRAFILYGRTYRGTDFQRGRDSSGNR